MTVRPTVPKMRWAVLSWVSVTNLPPQRRRDAGGEHGGRVGHGADDAEVFAGALLDGSRGDGGREGDDEFVRGQGGANLLDEGGDLDRLDAKENDVRLVRGGEIVGGDVDAVLGGEGERALRMGNGGGDLLGVEQIVFEEGLEQDAAHFAGAENGDAEGGHGCGSLREFVGLGVFVHK